MGRQKVGDDIRSGNIIELYQLVVYEILDTVPQMVTFFKDMPHRPQNGVHISWTDQNQVMEGLLWACKTLGSLASFPVGKRQGHYLDDEPVIFQERVVHFPQTSGLFQSHIPCGRKASQTIRKNLAKQRMVIPIRSHHPTEHAQVRTRISCTIILNKLWCLELGRHNNLREVGQTI